MSQQGPRDPKLIPLAVDGAIEAMEGDAPDGMMTLQFPIVEAAKARYNSPAYQAAALHRKNAADYRAPIVQGL